METRNHSRQKEFVNLLKESAGNKWRSVLLSHAVVVVTICSQYVPKEGLSVLYYFMYLTLLSVCPVCHLSVSVKSCCITSCS